MTSGYCIGQHNSGQIKGEVSWQLRPTTMWTSHPGPESTGQLQRQQTKYSFWDLRFFFRCILRNVVKLPSPQILLEVQMFRTNISPGILERQHIANNNFLEQRTVWPFPLIMSVRPTASCPLCNLVQKLSPGDPLGKQWLQIGLICWEMGDYLPLWTITAKLSHP